MKKIPITIAAVLVLLLLLIFTSGNAAADKKVQWKDPSWVQLEIDFPGNGYHASWHLSRCECGDLLIRSELNVPGEVTHGDILLVSQRVVLKRGYEPEQADQISFEAPALMMQLALLLLERSEPSGPLAITKRIDVDVSDPSHHINLDTGVAAGGFPAPWRVEGSIWPQAGLQRRFELDFSFNTKGLAGSEEDQTHMKLAGIAEYARTDFPLTEDMLIEPWDLDWRNQEDESTVDLTDIDTLGALRNQLDKSKP